MFGAGDFVVGLFCVLLDAEQPLGSACCMPVTSPSCDNQRCLRPCPVSPGEHSGHS